MNAHTDHQIDLTVYAPAYNEQDNITTFVREVDAVVSGLGKRYEILVVNDGSTDGTLEVLKGLMADYPALRVISLSKNSNVSAALDAGLRSARGRYIATLDADLQNDPADIPRMLAMVESGECDFVNGWRRRRNDSWLRLVSTKIANGIRNRLTGENIHDSACALKVYCAECMKDVKLFTGLHRFLPTLVKLHGYRVKEIEVNHRPRIAGVAKFGVCNRIFRGLRDTFAVRWMQSRYFSYEKTEIERSGAAKIKGSV